MSRELYDKGDFEAALNVCADKIKLNYNGFVGSVITSPDDILVLDCMQKVDKKSRTYARAQYYIDRALDSVYPSLAKDAKKIIKQYN